MTLIKELDFQTLTGFQNNHRQLEAHNALYSPNCKYLLYGGAAHGGKSHFLRWEAVGLGMYYWNKYKIEGVPIGLFSEDYPTLKDRQISKIKKEFPPWLGKLADDRDEGYMFVANPEYGGWRILLRNLDDPSKYASTEFAAELVEELTKNPMETFDDLRFRLRYTGDRIIRDEYGDEIGREKVPIHDVKFVGATNPGQIGHAWVKGKWIDPNPHNPDPEQERFVFVPSLPTDNPYTTQEYLKQLQAMPEAKRKAWLFGSWDVFEGQVFTEWSRPTHVVEPFAIPAHWKRYIAMDWGSNKPFSVGWYAQDEDGRTYLYRELYMNSQGFEDKFGKPLTAKRLAKVILAITRKAKETYEYCVADPSMWNKILLGEKTKAIQGESYAEIMINQGLKMIQGDNDRINGMAKYREALSMAPDGIPWYLMFSTCYDSIRTIPALVYDEHKIEDVDTDGEDHCYDRDRYLFMSRPPATPVPTKEEGKIAQYYQRIKRHSRTVGEES